MSRLVAENKSPARVSIPFFDRRQAMELENLPRRASGPSPTLGQLLKSVGDVQKEDAGDETPVHQVLDMSDSSLEPRSLPFVLSFNNLTYSVKISRKMTFPTMFRRRNRLGAATSEPVAGESLFTKTKYLM
ncbi:hypothetical protein L1049_011156 [Liquidambar formosana]|uniref:Uncharacterized protein n=1 Tax=Liquidambar formosana TaxID=63359 RepID=A0AAP0RW85_LIQFO